MQTEYGDISPRTAGYAVKQFLKRAIPFLVIEKFGQPPTVLPNNSTKVVIFRRYNALDFTPNQLAEGVTPNAKKLTKTDIPVNLVQYGDLIQLTDVVLDTHEDPVMMEAIEVLSEQAAQMIEVVRFNILKAGTNVFYANGTARTAVNTAITQTMQRRVVRALKRQNANKVTTVIRSTPAYETVNVNASFISLIHPDCEGDVRGMANFNPVEKYGQISPFESEFGKTEECRYVTSTIFSPWADAGGAAGGNFLSTSGTSSDVYPVLFVGKNSYGIVPLKGQQSVTPMVVNPKPSDSDPLAQRGWASWKSMQTAAILNDLWMSRLEVAASN